MCWAPYVGKEPKFPARLACRPEAKQAMGQQASRDVSRDAAKRSMLEKFGEHRDMARQLPGSGFQRRHRTIGFANNTDTKPAATAAASAEDLRPVTAGQLQLSTVLSGCALAGIEALGRSTIKARFLKPGKSVTCTLLYICVKWLGGNKAKY